MSLRIEKTKKEALSEFSSTRRLSNIQARMMETSKNRISTIASFSHLTTTNVFLSTLVVSALVTYPRKFKSSISYFYRLKNYSQVRWMSSPIFTEVTRSYAARPRLNSKKVFNWS